MRQSLLMCLLACGLLLGACAEEQTIEQQIIAVIGEMEENGEAGNRGAFMDRVHPSFSGQEGGMTREDFQRYMYLQWNQNSRLHAQLFPISVTEDWNQQASARFKVLVTGGRGFLPERGQVFEVFTIWQWEDGDWYLLRANWTPVDFEEVLPDYRG
jgi:hypothetical protein